MKILKTCLIILCLLPVLAVGSPQFGGASVYMEKIIELWKPIKGYEDHYEVSDQGRIRSKERYLSMKNRDTLRRHNAKIKSQTPHYKNNYLSVILKVKSQEKRLFVHRLVAEHFIPNPEKKPQVNHKRGIKSDNRASQLEWVTSLENVRHAIYSGLTNKLHPIIAIKDMAIMEFKSKKDCAEYIGCCGSWVNNAAKKGKVVNGFNLYLL